MAHTIFATSTCSRAFIALLMLLGLLAGVAACGSAPVGAGELACAKETFKSCPQDKKVAAKVADDAGHSRRTREIAHERRKATASVARRVVICGGRFVPPLGEAKAFVDVEAVLARGLVLALLLIVLAVSAVSILTVTSKDRAQRSDGIKVLRLLGRMLKDLLNTLRRGGRGEPPAA